MKQQLPSVERIPCSQANSKASNSQQKPLPNCIFNSAFVIEGASLFFTTCTQIPRPVTWMRRKNSENDAECYLLTSLLNVCRSKITMRTGKDPDYLTNTSCDNSTNYRKIKQCNGKPKTRIASLEFPLSLSFGKSSKFQMHEDKVNPLLFLLFELEE